MSTAVINPLLGKKYLAQLLREAGKISQADLDDALREQAEAYRPIGAILLDRGLIDDEDLAEALAEIFGYPLVDLEAIEELPDEVPRLQRTFLEENLVFPLAYNGRRLEVAVADPLDFYVLDELQLVFNCKLDIRIAPTSALRAAIDRFYGDATTVESIIEDLADEEGDLAYQELDDIDLLRDMAQEAPVVKLVNLVLNEAVERGASDIHFEALEQGLRVRYRIDGILMDVQTPPRKLIAAIISRIKIMAEMNIAERRLPQDGRIRLKLGDKRVDLRVSTIPTVHGESVVMRILDRDTKLLAMEDLGFDGKSLRMFESLIRRPHGIILVTGPTGSGKTTTLYAAMSKINSPEKKIITVEDPVEYQIPNINQIQVKPKIGLTFAAGLRSIVRQDPDIIMIGEIRDLETAEIAIQSALTGHMVFSTVHTNDAPSSVTRLADMGVEHFLVATCLEAVLAQRLVRRVCKACRERVRPPRQSLVQLGVADEVDDDFTCFVGRGCEVCSGTGYKGRSGIYELLVVDETMKELIAQRATAGELRRRAIEAGMKTLRRDGWEKIRQGVTTVAEVLRVTQDEDLVLEAL